LVEHAAPYEAIVRTCSALDVDLVVIGTRGLTGLKRILLGSVTDEVLRGIECDVLAVPPRLRRMATRQRASGARQSRVRR